MITHWHTGGELADTSGIALVQEVTALRQRIAELEAAKTEPDKPARKSRKS